MATLVLSVIGSAIAGPIGGAIGAVVGQQIDRKLLAPKGREGPRLNDLKIQTSSYGNAIPKVFGTMRQSGTVIWATDLQETRSRVSGGKNQPKSTQYSYSASFAVALSARPIARVGRIWADGKLLRGEAGDFKTPTGFRLYTGSEAQPVDPLIAAVEGASGTPAYRGIAYAVFEDFQLADYGNRIPSLSFEIIGDEGGTGIGAILGEIVDGPFSVDAPTALGGYAAYGSSVGGVVAGLAEAVSLRLRDDGSQIRLEEQPPAPIAIANWALGTSHQARAGERFRIDHISDDRVASRLAIAYADAERDYQPGRQHARREALVRRDEVIELPATMAADGARLIAENQLEIRLAARRTAQIALPWSYASLVPGQTLTISGRGERWMIQSTAFERMVMQLSLIRLPAGNAPMTAADAGRALSEADLVHGPSVVRLIDLPPVVDGARTSPLVVVAAAGLSPGWRRATLLMSLDDGASWQEIGETAAPAVLGSVASAVSTGQNAILDRVQAIEVDLLHSGMMLSSVTEAALFSGANGAMVGGELIQFLTAELIAPGRYRLTGLLRGRRGTVANAIPAGAPFTLIEAEALKALEVPVGTTRVKILTQGVGDPLAGTAAQLENPVASTTPLSPVHLTATDQPGGSTLLSWIRRSRDGWRWLDNVDAPLAEESERYRLTLIPNVGATRIQELSSPDFVYTAGQKVTDITAGASTLTVKVEQMGIFAFSPPKTLTFSIV